MRINVKNSGDKLLVMSDGRKALIDSVWEIDDRRGTLLPGTP